MRGEVEEHEGLGGWCSVRPAPPLRLRQRAAILVLPAHLLMRPDGAAVRGVIHRALELAWCNPLPAGPGGSPRRAAHRAQPRSANPELAGTIARDSHRGYARMFSFTQPELIWLALGFILMMAGMLAAAPE